MDYYKRTTQIPNFIFDLHLAGLTEAELKMLLVIARQTMGWLNKETGKRKARDRISISQFIRKTGMSKRTITKAIQSLLLKQLIWVTDSGGAELREPMKRKGRLRIFFSLYPVHLATSTSASDISGPVHQSDHNKTNSAKPTGSKPNTVSSCHIGALLRQRELFFNK
jgi:hypothetical protein